jgi:hypothetical protein
MWLSKKLTKYVITLIVLILLSGNVLCLQIKNSYENPRSYYDVQIIMISRMYDSIEIDGYHSLNQGFGFDDKITFSDSNKICLFGLFIISNETETLEYNTGGGWIHSKIEIFDYNGWMVCQHKGFHLLMFGISEMITITTYR